MNIHAIYSLLNEFQDDDFTELVEELTNRYEYYNQIEDHAICEALIEEINELIHLHLN